MSDTTRFSNLGNPNRIWTVSAIHGQLDCVTSLHRQIFDKFRPGDRLVYTGNYLCGAGGQPLQTLDEILHFRRALMARHCLDGEDLVYLRGVQEEMWTKLLQLQFAQSPREVVQWMMRKYPEMDGLLQALGTSLEEASRTSREGILSLTRWSNALKLRLREHKGYEKFFTVLRRAAYTENKGSNDNILFVHAGFNPELPLESQGDQFWWGSRSFSAMQSAPAPFRTIIRGCDPQRGGLKLEHPVISLDGGCGYGGKLVCAEMGPSGRIIDLIAA